MPIPVDDDRILAYIKPFEGVCPGGCGAYIINRKAQEISDTYWCPICVVRLKKFTLLDLSKFDSNKIEHIKQVVKKYLQENHGYFVNIHY